MKAFRHRFAILSLAAYAFFAFSVSGCTAWKTQQQAPAEVMAAKTRKYVRVTLAEGKRIELSYPRVEADSLVGYRGHLSSFEDAQIRSGMKSHPRVAIALAEIRKTEVMEKNTTGTVLLLVGLGITAALIIFAATYDAPSVDFSNSGSCPLLYSWDGATWRLDSGTFGGAIQQPLAREDVDNLEHATARDGQLELRLADELDETDYVDAVSVLAIDHDPAVEVAPDAAGTLLAYAEERAPVGAHDLDGRDALKRVTTRDGWSWESLPRLRDPNLEAGLRDGLELEFARPARQEACLLVDGQDTPWTAYLLGEYVRAHGRDEAAWQRGAEAHPAAARAAMQRLLSQGALQIELWTTAGWEPQGALFPSGPEVAKRQGLRLDLSRCVGSTVRLRLTSLPSFWLIDGVSLGAFAHGAIEAHELMLVAARDSAGTDIRDLLGSRDGRYYEMERGDAARLTFAEPEITPGRTRSYVARTSGWYRIHCDPTREPDTSFVRRIEREPSVVARLAVERANAALLRMETAVR